MSRKKILLVDDSSTMLMMEKLILRDDPYILLTASNGEEAIQKAKAEHPDLILLDVVMPRMGGFEACRLIREIEALKNVPIIMITPRGEATTVETDLMNGTHSITKPINAVELLAKVRSLTAESR
jgi:DNA-binding response OmpR family regulator